MQECELKEIPQRKILYMACMGPWRQLPEMLDKLSQYAAQVEAKTTGYPGAFYFNTPQEVDVQDLAWEVFYPIEADITEYFDEKTGFGVKFVEGVRAAATIHKGSYRNAASSYKRLQDWISIQGLKTCGAAEEAYLTDFSQSIEDQLIEICLPVCAA